MGFLRLVFWLGRPNAWRLKLVEGVGPQESVTSVRLRVVYANRRERRFRSQTHALLMRNSAEVVLRRTRSELSVGAGEELATRGCERSPLCSRRFPMYSASQHLHCFAPIRSAHRE